MERRSTSTSAPRRLILSKIRTERAWMLNSEKLLLHCGRIPESKPPSRKSTNSSLSILHHITLARCVRLQTTSGSPMKRMFSVLVLVPLELSLPSLLSKSITSRCSTSEDKKSERKKWVPFFEGVDCVLFVAAISGYNKTLFEDGKTNRMEDAMDLFEKTVKEKMLEKSSLVLFLNKSDLFQEEIKRFPITSCPRLADYTGDHSYKDTTNFIKEKFEKLVPPTRDCTIHITCATDRHNIKVVFDSVREHVLNESLAAAGLTQTMMQ
mmetsp:Transcript_19311/g.39085  ORF Transcript_19311/g.39085 Transcript_19311/m.39085 type:complete len:266 (+) Transcript_19311:358-1155(+)